MTLEHLTASRSSTRLVSIEPVSKIEVSSSFRKKSQPASSHQLNIVNSMSSRAFQSRKKASSGRVYSILLILIYNLIFVYYTLKIFSLAALYFIYENLMQYNIIASTIRAENYDPKFFQLPKHVCVILNDQSLFTGNSAEKVEEKIFNLYKNIADLLIYYDHGRGQVETITFFKFNEVSSELKERIHSNFKNSINLRADENNNNEKRCVEPDDSYHKNSSEWIFNSLFKKITEKQIKLAVI